MCISWLSNQNAIFNLNGAPLSAALTALVCVITCTPWAHGPPAASTCQSLVQTPCLTAADTGRDKKHLGEKSEGIRVGYWGCFSFFYISASARLYSFRSLTEGLFWRMSLFDLSYWFKRNRSKGEGELEPMLGPIPPPSSETPPCARWPNHCLRAVIFFFCQHLFQQKYKLRKRTVTQTTTTTTTATLNTQCNATFITGKTPA